MDARAFHRTPQPVPKSRKRTFELTTRFLAKTHADELAGSAPIRHRLFCHTTRNPTGGAEICAMLRPSNFHLQLRSGPLRLDGRNPRARGPPNSMSSAVKEKPVCTTKRSQIPACLHTTFTSRLSILSSLAKKSVAVSPEKKKKKKKKTESVAHVTNQQHNSPEKICHSKAEPFRKAQQALSQNGAVTQRLECGSRCGMLVVCNSDDDELSTQVPTQPTVASVCCGCNLALSLLMSCHLPSCHVTWPPVVMLQYL